jgi:hydroxypyruvate isomerase
VNGDDVDAAIDRATGRIGHAQIADAPGRHEPGTGNLPIERYLERIAGTGYDGWVGLEYVPSGPSAESFAWLPHERRSLAGRRPPGAEQTV